MSTLTSKSLAEPLCQRAVDLTAKHSREGAVSAPTLGVAAQSPLHELLIEEIAASIPRDLAIKLRASRSVAQAHDWIAAGAMYTWIKANRFLAEQFLHELGDRPHEAALVLAKTFARSLEPPAPDSRAPALDRLGLGIEGLFVTLFLGVRGLLFIALFFLATGTTWSLESGGIDRLVINSLVPELIGVIAPGVPQAAIVAFGCGSLWLLLETIWVPRILRYGRGFALRMLPRRIYADWRVDSTPAFWTAHALVLQFIFTAKMIQFTGQSAQLLWEWPLGLWAVR